MASKKADLKSRDRSEKRRDGEPNDERAHKLVEGLKPKTSGIKLSIGQKRKNEDINDGTTEREKQDKKTDIALAGVSLAFSTKKVEKEKSDVVLRAKKGSVAKAFGDDSDSEEEEMPKEARMRMRNIGRDTPTSAGPNSYNKGKLGFVNRNKLWDREMKPRIRLEKPQDED